MADAKISALAALDGVSLDDLDELVVVDKSDTTMASSGTDKKLTLAELLTGLQRRHLGLQIVSSTAAAMP